MATHWGLGRSIVAASSFCVAGLAPQLGAEETGDAGALPPIFSGSAAESAAVAQVSDPLGLPPSHGESTVATLKWIAEGLPKFDPKLAVQNPGPDGEPASPDQSAPIFMEPFRVFDAPAVDLVRPQENLLEVIDGTDPLFRSRGRNVTSELTFVDLAKAYDWRPFSLEPPPAVSVRFTISW